MLSLLPARAKAKKKAVPLESDVLGTERCHCCKEAEHQTLLLALSIGDYLSASSLPSSAN